MKAQITKCYAKGVLDKKAKPVECTFSFDVDRSRRSFDICVASSGSCEADALRDDGSAVFPRLQHAQIVGVHKYGLRVRGVCQEQDKNVFRLYFCEWYVKWNKTQE